MWKHNKIKDKLYVGNYEAVQVKDKWKRMLRLEHRNTRGKTVGKVYMFGNAAAAKKAGWIYCSK
jgi:hypothetical protein